MLEKLKKIKENKILKTIGDVLYTLMFLLVVLMLLVVIMQRATNNTLAIGGFRMFSVATGSMVPVYNVGDILISKEIDAEDIKVGDDLVYLGKKGSFSGRVVTHRVISIDKKEDGNYKIITQGVANNAADPEIDQTQVYGKVICNVKILGWIAGLVRNTYTLYFLLLLPVAILIVRNVRNIRDMDKEEENDEETSQDTEENKD